MLDPSGRGSLEPMISVEEAQREFLRMAEVTERISELRTCLLEIRLDVSRRESEGVVISANIVSNTSTKMSIAR